MPRRANPDLISKWKICLPATLAGKVEYLLLDPVLGKPIYAARAKLIEALLERWVQRQQGSPHDQLPPVPTVSDLRRSV